MMHRLADCNSVFSWRNRLTHVDDSSRSSEVAPNHVAPITSHLNFNVVSANSANTNAKIQNLAITFDSLHPINSK